MTWQDECSLVYEKGGLVRLALDKNGMKPRSDMRAGVLVLRAGTYECSEHEWREHFEQADVFTRCPVGGADCTFDFVAQESLPIAE